MNLGQDIPVHRTSSSDDVATDQPLDRALAVLGVVADAARPISITEIAVDCGLPVPTVHRLVAQLEKRGLLTRALGSKRVVVGSALVRLSMASLEAAIRADRPHQVLAALAQQIGEHVQIGRRVDSQIVYVDTAKAPRSEGLYFEQGRRAPLHCTSIGKLFLAEVSDTDLDWWLAHAPIERFTPSTIVAPGSLRAAVKRVRRESWACSDQEYVLGVVGCAVPIRDTAGRLIAGLGISAPSARFPFDQLGRYRKVMESAAAEIAEALSSED